ncbi:nucleotidyltransferase domain-containing protein [Lentzea sp. NEAU-D7]|uniref:nucleotidyltransferase domain-containing protein n=1 Tax=Lentzea sp. NEAU-D7 TaxID=2994667 RepID=UPI00224AC5E6|nr:nucleotidyltransferase domain-containing protein [Lentzea sp. NEAU-D7]MCX2946993.1 nucleotidyltransferase domain-containing protein [Lentzea sp. NEAU-D7]
MDDADLRRVLDRIRDGLAGVPGTAGLVLGGSRARGTARANSDVDVGLYYEPGRRPDFDTLLGVVADLDDRGAVDGFGRYGEWGPWINGGVWSRMAGTKVDILLRDVAKTRQVLADCAAGRIDIHYQPGHPHGFCTAIYAGEVFQNVPFHDPDGVLAELRGLVDPYPERLRTAVVERFGWEAGFSLSTAKSAAERGDVAYVTGCAFRTVSCLTQVVFAAERRYLTNEKGSVALVSGFASAPAGYAERVADALTAVTHSPQDLVSALEQLSALHDDVLAGV